MGALKGRMKEEESQLNNTEQSRMRLYRISESEGELRESLDTLNAGHLLELPKVMPLFNYFLNKSQSSGRAQSPSQSSHPSSFRERQNDKELQITCGRPRDLEETIPATLLHPVFGQFIDDCQTHTITGEDNNLVNELANAMSALHETEDIRAQAVKKVLAGYGLDFQLSSKVPRTAYVMDALISVTVRNNQHPCVIAEFKNEIGSSTSEPYMQAVTYYIESTRTFASKMSGFALLCFLFIVFGPYIVFAGAVWTSRPAAQILSSPLVFNYHSTDTSNQIAAARHMAAFRKAIRSLKGYYETLPPESELTNTLFHPILFPYPTSFKSLDDSSETCFKYTGQLDEDEGASKRLVFFGTLIDRPAEDAICIKFVRHYSQEVHLCCASSGLAPRLRGFKELPGGWSMVVMDKLVGYDVLADLPNTEHIPRSAFEPIREQLKELHAEKLVHGDIRDTNILVKKDDRTKFMIIDFDWAGTANVVLYPPYVNYTQITRPNDARDGLAVKAAHDDEMLDFIIQMRAE
ncbi:hypothetical protein BDR07DRAFT_1450949 [Suillus spraguei]|nr:hypothetical protein BDR07DRAFT_1450949 [Suillus spraguei]